MTMLHLTHTDWEAVRRAWLEGNDDGLGSAFGEDADTPIAAVAREGYEVLALDEDGSVLAHSKHKHYYYVCASFGPWGVDVTTVVRGIYGDELSVRA
jgi:hypothetical protein